MRASTHNAVRSYKLLFTLTVVVSWLAVPSGAADLTAIHLPGRIASDAQVGLAVSAPDRLYAAYWVEGEHDQPWQLLIYEFDITTGKVLTQSEVDKAEPLRSRNGDVIQSSVGLFISPDGETLLCTTLERGPVRKAWTLSSHDLHVLSSRTISPDSNLLGFTQNGDVRLLRVHKGGQFGQEIDSATVLDLSAQALDKNLSERTVQFQERAWELAAVGPDDLLWVLDERVSPQGDLRITSYNLQSGALVATQEVSLSEAKTGVPAAGPRPQGAELPAPTAIPQPGIPSDAPQLAQIMATKQGMLGVVNQSAKDWTAWSRVMSLGAPSNRVAWSSVLTGCDLRLDSVGRSERIAVGSCDLVGRTGFDQYAVKKSDAIFISTQTGSVVATLPLNTRRSTVSLAVDDSRQPIIAAIYDRRATVRVLSVPQ